MRDYEVDHNYTVNVLAEEGWHVKVQFATRPGVIGFLNRLPGWVLEVISVESHAGDPVEKRTVWV